MKLNAPQQEAVEHVTGPLVIFASAGSGKTGCVTHRISNLIENHGVKASKILAVTFTTKAAGEMKERLHAMLGDRVKGLSVGTFHATCVRILRRYAEYTGRRTDFVIYDDKDQESLLKAIVKDEETLAKDAGRKWPPEANAGKMAEAIEKQKRKLMRPDDIEAEDENSAVFKRVWTRYEASLKSANAYDFADLIVYGMHLAEREDEVGIDLRCRYDFVLVDEFQDTDTPQFRLVQALATNRNLCVVGDDDQCVYTWRGAQPENITQFRKHYPDATVVKLEENYRSTKKIVGAAAAIIDSVVVREPKHMWTGNPDGDPVAIVTCQDERDEARMVCHQTRDALKAGVLGKQIAVLYRTHAQSRAIEEELRAYDVNYKVHGGFRFFDRGEIRDAMAYLRLAVNPYSNVDLLRVINSPSRGVGPKALGRLTDTAASRGCSIYETLREAQVGSLGLKERQGIAAFRQAIETIREKGLGQRPSEAVALVMEQSGLLKFWTSEVTRFTNESKGAKAEDAQSRAENLQEMITDAARYEQRLSDEGETATLQEYVERVSLLAEEQKDEKADSVQLMTVHGAKGLQFDTVFIIGSEVGIFPSERAGKDDDEERRLMYVAVTRAQKRLYVSHAESRFLYGKTNWNKPSPYLEDMPPETAVWVQAGDLTDETNARSYG